MLIGCPGFCTGWYSRAEGSCPDEANPAPTLSVDWLSYQRLSSGIVPLEVGATIAGGAAPGAGATSKLGVDGCSICGAAGGIGG